MWCNVTNTVRMCYMDRQRDIGTQHMLVVCVHSTWPQHVQQECGMWCNITDITTSSYKGCWRGYRPEHMLVVCVYTEHAAYTYHVQHAVHLAPHNVDGEDIVLSTCSVCWCTVDSTACGP